MNTKTTTLTLAAIITSAAVLAIAIAPYVVSEASARITPVTKDTSCTNGGGNQPGGQQPSCQGSGLTQNTQTQNENPAGTAPPGQNK